MPARVVWPRTRGHLIFGGCMWTIAAACAAGLAFEFATIAR